MLEHHVEFERIEVGLHAVVVYSRESLTPKFPNTIDIVIGKLHVFSIFN